ncbi:MAG: hypothetical protein JWO06_3216 [Bacteroidota bacterium]|nr:hypothetical protein [Bacteroidota bacterium]
MINLRNNWPRKVAVAMLFTVFLYIVVYKAVHLPITHDEQVATLDYPRFTVWEIMMYTDNWPTNHILNTLCIKLSEHVFGFEPWMLRLPNILSFVLFYFIVYLISIRYFSKDPILFCLPFFIIFCNPFLLDFFGLARGYGMSNALMACSVYAVLRFSLSFRRRWYYLAILFSMLAAYANFTLLIYWAAVQIVLLTLQIVHAVKTKESLRKNVFQILNMGLLSIAFLALCYQPLYKMQSTNQFVYWSRESFFKDTLLNQVEEFLYGGETYTFFKPVFMAHCVVIVFTIAAVYSVYKIIRNSTLAISNPLVVSTLMLAAVWFVNMAQTVLMGTPYLSTRTALSYYVLFAFLFAFLVRGISLQIKLFRYTIVPALIFILSMHLYHTVHFNFVKEWWYDAHTYEVQNYLRDYRLEHPELKTIELNTSWIFNPSFRFYNRTGKTPWLSLTEYHKQVDTASQTLFYYATYDDASQLKNYRCAVQFPDVCNVLLIRKN